MSQAKIMTFHQDRRFSQLKRDLAHKTREEKIATYQEAIEDAKNNPRRWDSSSTITRSLRAIEELDYPVVGCEPGKPLIANVERAYLSIENCQTLAFIRWRELNQVDHGQDGLFCRRR